MSKLALRFSFILLFLVAPTYFKAQDTDEDDFSMYDDLDFADEAAKRYATSKVIGLSPQKLILMGYNAQGTYKIESGAVNNTLARTMNTTLTHGFQLAANIPVYSRDSLVVQLGLITKELRLLQHDLVMKMILIRFLPMQLIILWA